MTDYKEIAIEFAKELADCIEYYGDDFECEYCFSNYINGNVIHEDNCIGKKAIEFLNEVEIDEDMSTNSDRTS